MTAGGEIRRGRMSEGHVQRTIIGTQMDHGGDNPLRPRWAVLVEIPKDQFNSLRVHDKVVLVTPAAFAAVRAEGVREGLEKAAGVSDCDYARERIRALLDALPREGT
jgi:hypothetical protein